MADERRELRPGESVGEDVRRAVALLDLDASEAHAAKRSSQAMSARHRRQLSPVVRALEEGVRHARRRTEDVAERRRPAVERAGRDEEHEERRARTGTIAPGTPKTARCWYIDVRERTEGAALRLEPGLDSGLVAAHGLRNLRDQHAGEAEEQPARRCRTRRFARTSEAARSAPRGRTPARGAKSCWSDSGHMRVDAGYLTRFRPHRSRVTLSGT